MPSMSGIWYCFVGGLNFQRWSSCQEERVLMMKLQNFINEHTVDLENIQRIQKKGKGRIYKMFS
jgi:hypothetical protein